MKRIPFGEWLPDQVELGNPGATIAQNVIPQASSYRSLNAFITSTDAASEVIVGAIWNIDASGTVEIIVGTPTRLLRLSGASWTVVGSGFVSVTRWEFAQFGTNIIAVASGYTPQIIDLAAGSPSFSAISGSLDTPPTSQRVAVVRDHVVLGDIDTDSRLIQWSGFNNATQWRATGDVQTGTDAQILADGGRVQKIVGGEFGYVFQENKIRTLNYTGNSFVFSIGELTRRRGTPAADSVVAAGGQVFFYSQEGFFALQGAQFQSIGNERVNRWFARTIAKSEIPNIQAAVDRPNQLVIWAFKTIAGATNNDVLLIYNYGIDRWSYAEVDIHSIYELRTAGYNLDNINTVLGNDIDANDTLVDTKAFLGGQLALFGANSSGALGTFDGAPLTAVIETNEFDGGAGQRVFINNLRPVVEGTDDSVVITAQIGGRDKLGAGETFSPAVGTNAVDEIPITTDNRYNRVRLNIDGGFTHAIGVDVEGTPSGRF